MRAIVDGLVWGHAELPEPGPGEIRIRVHATAVNRADLLQASGLYPPPPGASTILGLEAAGVVDAVGTGVDGWRVGDRVCALLAGGGYAEYVVCPAGHALPIPDSLDDIGAAALPEVLCTAFLNLVGEAGMAAGDRVLLHAGASGVGTCAIQLCNLIGSRCWVSVGAEDKLQRCVDLGAAGGVNRRTSPTFAHVADWTEGNGFDVILCPVGGDYLAGNQRALAVGGRLVIIGLLSGREASLDLGRLLVKRQRIIGSVLRSRSVQAKTALIDTLRERVWPRVPSAIAPIVHDVLPIADAARAHALIASNETVGKVVLAVV